MAGQLFQRDAGDGTAVEIQQCSQGRVRSEQSAVDSVGEQQRRHRLGDRADFIHGVGSRPEMRITADPIANVHHAEAVENADVSHRRLDAIDQIRIT
nr:hypothetical protein [Mycolicibacterium obuense]